MTEYFFFEYGIPFPSFHINFLFPYKKEIQEPILFPKATHNLRFNRTGFKGRLKVLNKNTYCLYQDGFPHLTIIGDHNITVYLSTRIIKIENTPLHIFIRTKSLFISYDYSTFKIWDIKVTDYCTVENYLYIINNNILSTYEGEDCIKKTRLHKPMKLIKGEGDNILVVSYDNKVYLIDRFNTLRGQLVYDNGTVKDIALYKNYILIQKSTNLSVLDISNKKVEIIKNRKRFLVLNGLIIIFEQRGCFKYVEIGDLQNTKTTLYDEIIGGIDIYENKVYVLTRNGIYSWKKNKEEMFIPIKIVWPTLNIFNRIFNEQSNFKTCKKEEKIEYLNMEITECIKEDQGTKKMKKINEDSIFSIKKKMTKKGGF